MKGNRDIVVIAGSTGFLGGMLSLFLTQHGYRVIGLSRRAQAYQGDREAGWQIHSWNPHKLDGWERVLSQADAVINLAGENISALRWTRKKRERILQSRLQSTKILVQALSQIKHTPELFVQVSGIHYYGCRGDNIIGENEPGGAGFLASVAQRNEALTEAIDPMGIRRVVLRLGMVLSVQGGALPKLVLPFKWFVGGRMGDGRQWMAWVHAIDFCRAMAFIIAEDKLSGPVNLVSPQSIQNREMSKTVAEILKRPAIFPLPGWLIKILMGEMGQELLLCSQRALPDKLTQSGFDFKYPDFVATLRQLMD